jgi:hypothetical protein
LLLKRGQLIGEGRVLSLQLAHVFGVCLRPGVVLGFAGRLCSLRIRFGACDLQEQWKQ